MIENDRTNYKIGETRKINGFEFTEDYETDTNAFLNFCTANIKMQYLGKDYPIWDERRLHDMYYITILTMRNRMSFKFYDSIFNTEKNDKRTQFSQKRRVYPTSYDVIACLNKYDVGSLEDFMFEYGFEIKERGDFQKIMATYNGCCEEYHNLCKCFTKEQMEIMREIV